MGSLCVKAAACLTVLCLSGLYNASVEASHMVGEPTSTGDDRSTYRPLESSHPTWPQRVVYKVDRSRQRTSGILRNGEVFFEIDRPKHLLFNIRYGYDMSIQLFGRVAEERFVEVNIASLSNDIFEHIKSKGTLTTPQFIGEYLGTEAVTTIQPRTFEDTDIYQFTKIKFHKDHVIGQILHSLFPAKMMPSSGTEGIFDVAAPDEDLLLTEDGNLCFGDTAVRLAIKPGSSPMIGIVRLDVQGRRCGMHIYVGFDYIE